MAISIKEKIITIFRLIKEPKTLSALLSMRHSGYLIEQGWFYSFNKRSPYDKDGNPIPWLSYPSIDFLMERLKKDFTIFEFGSGNSTIFYASEVNKIISVEHNIAWFKKLENTLPDNAKIIYSSYQPDGDYCRMAHSQKDKFDLIIVDGMDRVKSIFNSVESLNETGVLILDDSERNEYSSGIDFLSQKGFNRLDFWGISAGELYKKCTTIFYRSKNCLNI